MSNVTQIRVMQAHPAFNTQNHQNVLHGPESGAHNFNRFSCLDQHKQDNPSLTCSEACPQGVKVGNSNHQKPLLHYCPCVPFCRWDILRLLLVALSTEHRDSHGFSPITMLPGPSLCISVIPTHPLEQQLSVFLMLCPFNTIISFDYRISVRHLGGPGPQVEN